MKFERKKHTFGDSLCLFLFSSNVTHCVVERFVFFLFLFSLDLINNIVFIALLNRISGGIEDQETIDEMCVNVIRDMNEFGVCVLDNFLGDERGLKVLDEVKSMYNAGFFKVSSSKKNVKANFD